MLKLWFKESLRSSTDYSWMALTLILVTSQAFSKGYQDISAQHLSVSSFDSRSHEDQKVPLSSQRFESLLSRPPVGKGIYQYYLWKVYSIALYSETNTWPTTTPFALKLDYLRSIKGIDIAKASVKQMRKQGFSNEIKLAAWFTQMHNLFPDITKGDALTGIFIPNQGVQFWSQGTMIGAIHDPDFSVAFANIWLGSKTTAPQLRKQLTGLAQDAL